MDTADHARRELDDLGTARRLARHDRHRRNANGRLALFGANGYGQVRYREQATPGGVMSGWIALDGSVRAVAAETNADGRIELFGIGA